MTETKGATRKIQKEIPPDLLSQDLECYCQSALAEGATKAKIIPAQWVNVDERVRLKCFIPRCPNYGQCASCPPYCPDPELFRRSFCRYSWAILLKKDIIPADDLADQDKIKQGAYIKHVQEIAEIVAKIETMAFADGYYLALGLASGGCKDFLCRDNLCQVIDGGRCPYPLKARPSMEAASIDVFGLVASVGWEGYPIYATIDPKLVPLAILVGLIFVY